MGDVIRTHDSRLDRGVAINISKKRIEREAREIAAQIYDVGPNYLVMELVEGPTLAGIG